MKHFHLAVATFFVLLTWFSDSDAVGQSKQGAYSGAAALLRDPAVYRELATNREQIQKIGTALPEIGQRHADAYSKVLKLTDREAHTKLQELIDTVNKETFRVLVDVLDEKQMNRFRQIDRQEQGPRLFRDKEIVGKLKLTRGQQVQVYKIGVRALGEIGAVRRRKGDDIEAMKKEFAAARKKSLDEIVALFTDEQKKIWDELLGEPFESGGTDDPASRPDASSTSPRSGSGPSRSNAKTVAAIDKQIASAQTDNGITPAPVADDAAFLRRVTIDLIGRLPDEKEVVAFLRDLSPDKRSAAIDRLLADDRYAEHWATYWDAVLMGRLTVAAILDRAKWKAWLIESFQQNKPWDEFATQLVTASGYNTNTRPKGAKGDPSDIDERFNPATNWFLRHSFNLPELSGATARVFLGVRIECSQCHDHPTEKWTQNDFRQFTALFAKTYPAYFDRSLVLGIHRVDTKDRLIYPPTTGRLARYFGSYSDYVRLTPKLLDGPEVTGFGSRRQALAEWMTASDNPWFARAMVNRMWGRLLGVGFVEPINDFRPGNPPALPETLDALADEFVASGFDLKHLLRIICHTRAYQTSSRHVDVEAGTPALWASYPLKALDIEVLFDSILQATDSEAELNRVAKGNMPLVRQSFVRQFVKETGTDEMSEVADEGESISRALLQLNGSLFNETTRALSGLGLASLLDEDEDRRTIERLYLRTLSRQPDDDEVAYWTEFVNKPREHVKTDAPTTRLPTGLAGLRASDAIRNAGADADFRELIAQAKTGADFKALAGRMRNNADAGMYAKAIQEFAARVPFDVLASRPGARTARQQAWEDMFWALINSSEFLTNH